MSPDNPDYRNEPDPSKDLENMLRSLLGDDAEEAMRQLRARGLDPAELLSSAGAPDSATMSHMIAQVQRLLSTPAAGPVNPEVAHDVARQVAVTGGDPVVNGAQAHAATEALAVADLWLDTATEIAPSGAVRHAWSRSQWVEATLPAWNTLAAPVAASVADALATLMADQLGERFGDETEALSIPGMPSLGQDMDPAQLMRRMGSAVYGMQIGQAAGTLSREVFGATDIGIPLLADNATVLVPANVEAFAQGLDAPLDEVRQFLAIREAAHARLFTHVSWLRAHLLGLVEAYARGITIDLEELESRLTDIDPTDAAGLQRALTGGVFGVRNTPEQESTLLRLETTLALVEGWVDEVSTQAALPHLPHTIPLREMIRRRRAAGGPAEHTFAGLVGLELRPRRSRDAAALWALIARESGIAGRDRVWDHPDLLPQTVDLEDPSGYRSRQEAAHAEQADVDRALAEILGDEEDEEKPES